MPQQQLGKKIDFFHGRVRDFYNVLICNPSLPEIHLGHNMLRLSEFAFDQDTGKLSRVLVGLIFVRYTYQSIIGPLKHGNWGKTYLIAP